MRRRWVFPESEPRAPELARALGIGETVASILSSRGMRDVESARAFLKPSIASLIDPLLMRDMETARDRLLRAIRDGERIRILGDYDVDGITSTVLLKTALEMVGGRVSFSIPHRLKDGYGIGTEAIERAAADGVSLIVSVDTGIRAARAIAHAKSLGIDAIVTDHHLPDAELPPALAVVNPNRPDCTYPEKHLCGAAVAFKLAQAILSSLDWDTPKRERMLASLLKLVAIATVADVTPLVGENRTIVWHGLRGLRDVRNVGLRALLDAAGLRAGAIPSAMHVGFRIAPRLNAAGRMASAEDAVELFLTSDAERARDIAKRLSAWNGERQQTEEQILTQIVESCEAEAVDVAAPALVFCAPDWHRGVLGIVASRLAERFHRPVFVLSSENGEASGSGRSIPGFHLLEALESMPHLFSRFGGHKQAAGVTLATDQVSEFRRALAAWAGTVLTESDLQPTQRIDAIVRLPQLNDDLWRDLQELGPFGMDNRTPVFAACGVRVLSDANVKKSLLLFNGLQDGRGVTFKTFRAIDRAGELTRGATIDVAFTLEWDDYEGGWCARAEDFRPAVVSEARP